MRRSSAARERRTGDPARGLGALGETVHLDATEVGAASQGKRRASKRRADWHQSQIGPDPLLAKAEVHDDLCLDLGRLIVEPVGPVAPQLHRFQSGRHEHGVSADHTQIVDHS